MYFGMKNILKNNCSHIPKQTLNWSKAWFLCYVGYSVNSNQYCLEILKKNYIILNFKKSNQILTKLIELRVNILSKSY